MTVQYMTGDLFAIPDMQVLAHGCNCAGVMGAGIARSFRTRYPAMYLVYQRKCRASVTPLSLGDAWVWRDAALPWVANLATQVRPGSRAIPAAIRTSLHALRQQCETSAITRIAMPHIGCGLGGLRWEQVQPIVEDVWHDWAGTLIVVAYG